MFGPKVACPNITQDRADLVPGKSYTTPGTQNKQLVGLWCLSAPLAGTLDNERNNAFHGPYTRRADISVFKNFDITERLKAQFRAEVYNSSNTPNFSIPKATIGFVESPIAA